MLHEEFLPMRWTCLESFSFSSMSLLLTNRAHLRKNETTQNKTNWPIYRWSSPAENCALMGLVYRPSRDWTEPSSKRPHCFVGARMCSQGNYNELKSVVSGTDLFIKASLLEGFECRPALEKIQLNSFTNFFLSNVFNVHRHIHPVRLNVTWSYSVEFGRMLCRMFLRNEINLNSALCTFL